MLMVEMLEGLEFVEIESSDLSKIVIEDREMKGTPRLLKEILPLAYQQGRWTEEIDYNKPLYFMFRDVCRAKDEEKIRDNHLRFDITIMLPLKLGLELNKTAGHYHPFVPSTTLSYPELYEIIDGRAYFILQNVDGDAVLDAFIIKAKKGDRVIVPPNYGHVTVNAGATPLIIANWVCRDFSSIYQPYADKRGAVYYIIRRFGNIEVVENEAYVNIPSPKFVESKANEVLKLSPQESMYKLVDAIDLLAWLKEPQNHTDIFERSVIFEILDD
jgi:glucose-6-phosphate isomerase